MLGDLISGTEKSALVLLEDTAEPDVTSDYLLVSFIHSLATRLDLVVLLCYEKLPDFFTSVPCLKNLDKLRLEKLNDVAGWGESGSSTIDVDVRDAVAKHISPDVKSVAVVIDALTFHLLCRPPSFTCQMLSGLKRAKFKGDVQVEQVVCRLHRDLHPAQHLTLVHHGIPTLLSLSPLPHKYSGSSSSTPDLVLQTAVCTTRHVRPCGKVIQTPEEFVVDTAFKIKVVGKLNLSKPVETSEVLTEPDPTANLTFNLSLTESERQARSNVRLPYTQAPVRANPSENSDNGGKVFYLPDDADDFDEEDPDDDLDI